MVGLNSVESWNGCTLRRQCRNLSRSQDPEEQGGITLQCCFGFWPILLGVTLVVLVVAAFLTSTLSGVLGMGGGITLVGVMAAVLPAPLVVPLHGVVQLCSNLTRTIVFLPHVRWRFVAVYAPFLVVGVVGAASVWSGDLSWFKPFIGLFLLLFLASRRYARSLRLPPLWLYAPLGAVTGFLSLFVGATGPFLAPFFLRDDFDKEQVIATKAMCQAFAHVLKIPAFLALGFRYQDHLALLVVLVAMVVLGTLTGKKLLSHLDQRTFERLFVVLLAALALHLILGAFLGGSQDDATDERTSAAVVTQPCCWEHPAA